MKKIICMIVTISIFMVGLALPSTGEAALGDRTLSKGTSHNDVRELQELLMTKGVYPYHEPTGYYGSITQEAVKDFQKKSNLKRSEERRVGKECPV